ncbi:hypothetical protein FRB91_011222 [Serendipita sp. 411]|nr:hypothetical protein FRB91_011222 [Serendipita sp. 411]
MLDRLRGYDTFVAESTERDDKDIRTKHRKVCGTMCGVGEPGDDTLIAGPIGTLKTSKNVTPRLGSIPRYVFSRFNLRTEDYAPIGCKPCGSRVELSRPRQFEGADGDGDEDGSGDGDETEDE